MSTGLKARPRTGVKKTFRQLAAGESIPSGTPRRYKSSHGYIRLRWLVAPRQYVEVMEHRLVAGVVTSDHVHHKNRNKADNDPANLEILTASQHITLHRPTGWDVAEAARLYVQGATWKSLGARYGINPVTVMRALRKRGVQSRDAK